MTVMAFKRKKLRFNGNHAKSELSMTHTNMLCPFGRALRADSLMNPAGDLPNSFSETSDSLKLTKKLGAENSLLFMK